MNKCYKCDTELSNERVHLGFDSCLECSGTEKYSSHTVYPHKTGGYIQPVSSEKSDELKRLDRRATGSGRIAKGIYADQSWDRWLKKYNEQVSKRTRTRTANPMLVGSTPTLLSINKAKQMVIDKYDSRGYYSACELTQSLYSKDKISLMDKSKLMNELAELQMMSVDERKFYKKLEKKA